jgi:xanthine dehydrogenase accessory factor
VTLFSDRYIVVRGGGDLATGVVARLHRAGFPIIILELPQPLAIRRTVSLARAVTEQTAVVEDLTARLTSTPSEAQEVAGSGDIAVLASGELPDFPTPVTAVIDARLAKTRESASIDRPFLTVGLGPGFVAGENCHAVVETMRGHHLGRVLWTGSAAPDTGIPGLVGGHSARRVIRADRSGVITWNVAIGDSTEAGATIGRIDDVPIEATLSGVIRGLIDPAVPAHPGLKIADIDPRADREACFEISDKALAVGGGVLEAILTALNVESSE